MLDNRLIDLFFIAESEDIPTGLPEKTESKEWCKLSPEEEANRRCWRKDLRIAKSGLLFIEIGAQKLLNRR